MRRKQKERVLLHFFVVMLVIMVPFLRSAKAENAFVVEEESTFGGEERKTSLPESASQSVPQPVPQPADVEGSQADRAGQPKTREKTLSENTVPKAQPGEPSGRASEGEKKAEKPFVVPKKNTISVSDNAVAGEGEVLGNEKVELLQEAEPSGCEVGEKSGEESDKGGKTPWWWIAMAAAGLLAGGIRIVWRIRIRYGKL